jgi:hypothetical protein
MPRSDDDEVVILRGAGAKEWFERNFSGDGGGEGEGDEEEEEELLAELLEKRKARKAGGPAKKVAGARKGYFSK